MTSVSDIPDTILFVQAIELSIAALAATPIVNGIACLVAFALGPF